MQPSLHKMPKHKDTKTAQTTIYRLIAAAQLARQALVLPLGEWNLQVGDDAIVLDLAERGPATRSDLSQSTGLAGAHLDARVLRLINLDLVEAVKSDDTADPLLCLTPKGEGVADHLRLSWQQLEEALTGELSQKRHKKLRQTLKRFVDLLSL